MLSFMIIIVSLTLTQNLYLFGLQLCLEQITGITGTTDFYTKQTLVGHLTKFTTPVKQGIHKS